VASLTYTVGDRATLVAGHAVGESYSIDVKLRSFQESMDAPKTQHVSMSGLTETVLRRATKIINATITWPDLIDDNMQEFIWSTAGGELFTFDAYGTVALPDDPIDVISVNGNIQMMPIQRIKATSRMLTLNMRPTIARL